jgi:rhodanese-related sulfurtransferase
MRTQRAVSLTAVVLLLLLLLAAALAAAGCSSDETASPAGTSPPAEAGGYSTVDVQTAYDAVSSDQSAQLLDVREPEEWAETGVPEGAVLIPLAEVASRAPSELDAGSPVYVICRSGNRSRTASDTLVQLGFGQVYNVDGGVTAWLDAGLPVEAYQP